MQPSRVALPDLLRTVELPPSVSAAIVSQVAVRLDRWATARRASRVIVPRLEDLMLERGGRVYWRRGRSLPIREAVRALGGVLDALLARAPHRQIPPPLVYLVSRATDANHLAPIESLHDLAAAISRHCPARPAAAIDAAIARWAADVCGAPSLGPDSTIADVRRRRREGGTSLKTIAGDTDIPVSLLRELEWGVYDNWPIPLAAGSIAAYAARAGLDPETVLSIVDREQETLQPRRAALPVVSSSSMMILIGRAPAGVPQQAMPFALAALLALVVALAAPSDSRTAVPAPGAALSSDAVLEEAPVVEPIATGNQEPEEAAGAATRDENTQPMKHQPRRPERNPSTRPAASQRAASATASLARNSDRERGRPAAGSGAFVRLAHALTGDGRHKVAPFPRPAGEQ
jgi:cytoskeletal protein RodZ